MSAEQRRELDEAKDMELNAFVKYSVVEAASRQGISPSALMNMRWVMTFKDAGQLKARLAVQGFTDPRLGKIPTSSPTAPRRPRQIFLTLAAPLGFQTHKADVECAFLRDDLEEQHVDDNDDDDFKVESAQPASDTFCAPVPELSGRSRLEHHQCVCLLKAVHCVVNALRRRYHRVATDLGNMGGEEWNLACGLSFQRRKWCHSGPVCGTSCWACSDSPFAKRIFDGINMLYEWDLASHACSHSAAHESHKPTTNTPKHGADLRLVSRNT